MVAPAQQRGGESFDVGSSAGRQGRKRPAQTIAGPEQSSDRPHPECLDIPAPYRPSKQIRLDLVGWIEECLIASGLDAELSSEPLAQPREIAGDAPQGLAHEVG